jgi:hypothetical protein
MPRRFVVSCVLSEALEQAIRTMASALSPKATNEIDEAAIASGSGPF